KAFRWVTCGLAGLIALVLLAIALQITVQAFPALQRFGLGFLLSTTWDPNRHLYGVLPQIYGTLITSLLALGLALPIALGVAIVLSENLLPRLLQTIISFLIELLAAIPSVVYGMWGWLILIPQIRPFGVWVHERLGFLPWFSTSPVGPGIYVASLVLAVMILPIMAAIARDSLLAVPSDVRQAAYSVGATRWEVLMWVTVPIAVPGILTGIVLALGRALGETMAVTMLIGEANIISPSIFAPGSTITSLLANQFTAAKDDQIAALMYATLVLFGITLLVNGLAEAIRLGLQQQSAPLSPAAHPQHTPKLSKQSRLQSWLAAFWAVNRRESGFPTGIGWSWRYAVRSLLSATLTSLALVATVIALIPLMAVLGYVILNGIPHISLELLTSLPPPPLVPGGGIGNAIVGTLMVVGLATLISAPIGVLAAIALSEVIRDTTFARVVSIGADVLSGVPAIVIGVFAYGLVVVGTGTFSVLAGGIALGILMLPMIVRTATESLRSVPDEIRWGAIALGATEFQTSLQIVLPAALPGITTGLMLSIARAAGETAPVLFTALFSQFWFQPRQGLLQPVATLSMLIYTFATVPYQNQQQLAWAAALVLVLLVLTTNIVSRLVVGRRSA
ncbi:MAG: phosphate ABC transporter permease PstA, partial [Cyanobacteriota bacterium SKYGB_h_bin112]|nr:phosphate ABC transporter permease PstA [Cyanobacteriota bacterium SKYGB_h_bin112]